MTRIIGLLVFCALAAPAAAERLPVRVVKDVAYRASVPGADGKDKLDLYLPQGKTGAPVIVWYYGGALQEGDKSDATEVGAAERFAAAGIATAVVNYRLSPGVSHPAHIRDAAASFAWALRYGTAGRPEGLRYVTGTNTADTSASAGACSIGAPSAPCSTRWAR